MLKTYLKTRLLYALFLIAGCSGGGGGGSSSQPVQNNTPPPASGQGNLSLYITDAPVDDVVEVWVQFEALELKPEEGESFTIEFEEPKDIDLLQLTGDNTAELLGDEAIESGRYNWIRLAVNADEDGEFDSFVLTEIGEMIELEVTSQQGLRLVSGFNVPDGGSASFVIDWDLRKGLTAPKGANKNSYKLRPALRITDLNSDAVISGFVAEELLTDESCTNDLAEDTGNAVYLYAEFDIEPEDIHTEETDPVATAEVKQDENGMYAFQMDFIEPGDYTIAFTCQALDDDPETDDDIAFVNPTNITVTQGEDLTVDF